MAVKKGLGKGLDSLITDKVNTKPAASKNNPTPKSEHAADAIMMNITKVEPNREQPRKKFDEDALLELAESIKQYGVLQPLLVQEREDYYEIVKACLFENFRPLVESLFSLLPEGLLKAVKQAENDQK